MVGELIIGVLAPRSAEIWDVSAGHGTYIRPFGGCQYRLGVRDIRGVETRGGIRSGEKAIRNGTPPALGGLTTGRNSPATLTNSG